MENNQSSDTAIFASMQRATHQFHENPPIFNDSISKLLIKELEHTQAWKTMGSLPDVSLKRSRAMIALRSQYSEDILRKTSQNKNYQYVILGAGYDTFAYRQSQWTKNLTIYEVDHPMTQKAKQELIHKVGFDVPKNVTFCPIDFQTTSLKEALAKVNFDFSIPTIFSWLGVTQYISKEANQATFKFIKSLSKGSAITFSFLIDFNLLNSADEEGMIKFAELTKSQGEPILSTFSPQELKELLTTIGFSKVEHLTPVFAQEKYFSNREDGFVAEEAEQCMTAFV